MIDGRQHGSRIYIYFRSSETEVEIMQSDNLLVAQPHGNNVKWLIKLNTVEKSKHYRDYQIEDRRKNANSFY